MTPYLFWELLFLGIGVWVLAFILVVYAWILLKRQERLINFVLDRFDELPVNNKTRRAILDDLRPNSANTEKTIAIAKDEPISKYADMTMSDSVNVSFVEPPHEKND